MPIDPDEIEFLSREALKDANPAAERFVFSVGLEAGNMPAKVDVAIELLQSQTISGRPLSQAEWIELLREFLNQKGEQGWDPTTEDTLSVNVEALAAARQRLGWPA
ncbi:MAG: hypothetical protein HY653_08525 [Acidobacteria bacterium]|nr:hypothetical protein [Acidobacteriota bacterium]